MIIVKENAFTGTHVLCKVGVSMILVCVNMHLNVLCKLYIDVHIINLEQKCTVGYSTSDAVHFG